MLTRLQKEGSGCIVMLREWRVDDLKLVYDVLSLVPGALNPCVELVRAFCTEQGLNIVMNKDLEEKPLDMVEQTIKLKEKYDELLDKAFSVKKSGNLIRDKDFVAAVKRVLYFVLQVLIYSSLLMIL